VSIRYLSTTSAAEALGVTRQTIARLIYAGEIKAANIAPAHAQPRYRISEDELRRFMDSRQPDEPPVPAPRVASA
jgi:excisionase family DNA binding protein